MNPFIIDKLWHSHTFNFQEREDFSAKIIKLLQHFSFT
jgi:hypothetical protein